ncbi:MAG TPA: phosphatidylserine decarboxylase [Bacillota bacterium]|nr:phosphatidylserine decarboxylase [Bacillota bacterium]
MVKYLGLVLLGLLGLHLFLRRIWFYRDPRRRPPAQADAIISPADGIVLYVRPIHHGEVEVEKAGRRIRVEEILRQPLPAGGDGWLVGVYMSPLNVHFNYAPIAGEVTRVAYTPTGVNLPMVGFLDYLRLTYLRRAVDLLAARYRLVNERNTILLRQGDRMVAAVEICDRFVNRITCFVREGDQVTAGQKLSFIDRGSQVDLVIFDARATVLCRPGDRVTGAETILALWGGATSRA